MAAVTAIFKIAQFVGAAIRVVKAMEKVRAAAGRVADAGRKLDRALRKQVRDGVVQVEYRQKYNHLPAIADALGPALDKALRQIAQEIEDSAKRRAPVRTGALRDSIRVGASNMDGNRVAMHGNRVAMDGNRVAAMHGVTVTAGVPYALFVELGTSRMRPRPYLRPAVEEVRPRVEAIVSAAVRDAIRHAR